MPQGGSVSLEMLPSSSWPCAAAWCRRWSAALCTACCSSSCPGPSSTTRRRRRSTIRWPYAGRGARPAWCWCRRLAHAGKRRLVALFVRLLVGARFVFHFLSGLIFFASYAPGWGSPWLYSITYNLLYLVPEAVITRGALAVAHGLRRGLPGRQRGGRDA